MEQLLRIQCHAFMQYRCDLHIVLALIRWHRMYGDLGQCRVNSKGCFHFKAGNVFASAAQIILLAIDEVEKAIVIELANVTSVEPHVAHQLLGVFRTAPVALEHDVRTQRTNHNFAGAVRRYFLIEVVDDAYIEIRNAFSRGARRGVLAGGQ
ncbi:hypothetical protein D3C85_1357440 [compost metagenome]